jgi:hypothetical protein
MASRPRELDDVRARDARRDRNEMPRETRHAIRMAIHDMLAVHGARLSPRRRHPRTTAPRECTIWWMRQ